MAIHARWRWPPESSSTEPVGEVDVIPVASEGVVDRGVVGRRPLAEPALVRVAAAADEVGDGDAVGRDRLLGQDAEPGGDLAGRQLAMSWPSSSTAPAVGVSSRARPRSSVDLPQALAPTIAVTWPVGIDSERSSTIVAVVVAERHGHGVERSDGWSGIRHPPVESAVGPGQSQSRYGRAEHRR